MTSYEIVSTVLGVINLISVFALIHQIKSTNSQLDLSRKQLEQSQEQKSAQHEEQRRIMTVNVLKDWCSGLKKEYILAEKIVHRLDINTCRDLYNYNPITIDEASHKLLCQMCSMEPSMCKECNYCTADAVKRYHIQGVPLNELRNNVTNYLNALEVVALSWQQAIVDKKAIEEQFSYLYTPGTKSALENYRTAAGNGKSYSLINSFYKQIAKNHQDEIELRTEQ